MENEGKLGTPHDSIADGWSYKTAASIGLGRVFPVGELVDRFGDVVPIQVLDSRREPGCKARRIKDVVKSRIRLLRLWRPLRAWTEELPRPGLEHGLRLDPNRRGNKRNQTKGPPS